MSAPLFTDESRRAGFRDGRDHARLEQSLMELQSEVAKLDAMGAGTSRKRAHLNELVQLTRAQLNLLRAKYGLPEV